jgi:small subunit ribosomal protein S4e
MVKLKKLLAPKFWHVPRKASKWVVAPSAGSHPKFECIPLQILLRNILRIAETGKEAKKIITAGEIFVDGKARKDTGYPVGLFDVISVPKLKKFYRVVPAPSGLEVVEISEKESKQKIVRIENKKTLSAKKIQLNLHDSKNILVENDVYKTGDCLAIEIPSLKILEHLPLRKGAKGIVVRGRNAGREGKVKEIISGTARSAARLICEIDGEEKEVSKKDFFVTSK